MGQGPSIDLSSFLDIMTCVLGILILIILLTGIDASQIQVLVATPKELSGDTRSPVFFECRNEQLFEIDYQGFKDAVDKKIEELWEKVQHNEEEFIRESAVTYITVGGYQLDFTQAMIGKYALRQVKDAQGYKLEGALSQETPDKWFGGRLAAIDPETQFICFFVRPDSFSLFQKARSLAWQRDINASCELLAPNDPIIFGPGGNKVTVQ